ncbi:acyltransferase [Sphingomonas sp. CGMCC 1.13654]|uniref:Acyltransferase n=1 Tax=Sphingomonas chungangi TaxID=2683589 RepID=A0A838LCU9_9SPHN|nr:acyltransferase [Sphingomonas chungangi]MBA2935956.1 acyltransferase [Sphingomonas chungangi]MVW55346.1 acyltransferase family protein [Sphingomonas chungangi]
MTGGQGNGPAEAVALTDAGAAPPTAGPHPREHGTAALYLTPERMPATPGYIPSLDGMRAISILLVIGAHYISPKLFPGGLGVSVFFVISGFLISRLIFSEWKRTKGFAFGGFYLRRALRLYPVVALYTGAVVTFYLVTARPIEWLQPASALFYFANYLYGARSVAPSIHPSMPLEIFWSLSVEEHFYLLFPLSFWLLRGRPRAIIGLMISVCLVCLALRTGVAWTEPHLLSSKYFYFRTEFRLDAIAFGVLIAALCEDGTGRAFLKRATRPTITIAAFMVILGCLVVRDAYFRETLRYTLTSAAIMLITAAVLFQPDPGIARRLLNSRPLVWIGRLSYSLYVWHIAAPFVVYPVVGGMSREIVLAARLIGAFGLATLSYHLVERPMLRLRHRFGSRARAAD